MHFFEISCYIIKIIFCTDVRDDKNQTPLDIALECANSSYKSGGVDVAYYLMMKCGCGSEEEKVLLLCTACYHGKLDMVKKLVLQHNVDPNSECSIVCMLRF